MGTFQYPIMVELNLSSTQFSLLSTSAYLLIYGIMQIPAGFFTDRYGLKRALLVGALICSFAMVGMSWTHNFSLALCFRALTGLGASFGFICLLVSIYEWMPHRKSAFLIGLSQFVGVFGPMIAAGPLNGLAKGAALSWRMIFFLSGLTGLILALFILLLVKNNRTVQKVSAVTTQPRKVKKVLKELLSHYQPWSIAFFSAFIHFPIEYLSENEGKIFLMLKGNSAHFASYAISGAWLGYALGCPLLGFLSDHFQRRKMTLVLASTFSLLAIIAFVFSSNAWLLILAFSLIGITASSLSISFATMAEQCRKGILTIGLAFNNTVITTFPSIAAPLIGWTIDSVKKGKMATLADYQTSFGLLIALACVPLALSLFVVKETFCRSNPGFP